MADRWLIGLADGWLVGGLSGCRIVPPLLLIHTALYVQPCSSCRRVVLSDREGREACLVGGGAGDAPSACKKEF